MTKICQTLLLLSLPLLGQAAEPIPFPTQGRLVVLGDSITYSGHYVALLEFYVRTSKPDSTLRILNLGLPSETVSGLSEPGHAGGSFPRPDLHERLERVLEKTHPTLILACYGMNDGIYYPYARQRFQAFRNGMDRLREKAGEVPVIHVTPPVFDPVPIRNRVLPRGREAYPQPYEGYDEVLGLYGAWLLAQRGQGWSVVDVHGPMRAFLRDQRLKDPKFLLAEDGVHANDQGHWLIAREILLAWGASPEWAGQSSPDVLLGPNPKRHQALDLIRKKQRLLSDAWLIDVGHKRPGMAKGKPLGQAQEEADRMDGEIEALLTSPH